VNVFVIGTGRCGTMTFSRACSHLTNFTSGHESRANCVLGRVDYPANHIESDARLTWFLGVLRERYPDAYYVNLHRNRDDVVTSMLRRWQTSGVLRFFRLGAIHRMDRQYQTERDRRALCELYLEVIEANIRLFTLGCSNLMDIDLSMAGEKFPMFLDWIGAEGNRTAAIAEWNVRYNASVK
jgi:hypothetical protein